MDVIFVKCTEINQGSYSGTENITVFGKSQRESKIPNQFPIQRSLLRIKWYKERKQKFTKEKQATMSFITNVNPNLILLSNDMTINHFIKCGNLLP